MVFTPRQMWWLNAALVLTILLTGVSWGTFGVPPHVVAFISQGCAIAIGLLNFAIHGTIPGVGMSERDPSRVPPFNGGTND